MFEIHQKKKKNFLRLILSSLLDRPRAGPYIVLRPILPGQFAPYIVHERHERVINARVEAWIGISLAATGSLRIGINPTGCLSPRLGFQPAGFIGEKRGKDLFRIPTWWISQISPSPKIYPLKRSGLFYRTRVKHGFLTHLPYCHANYTYR